jgi:hypothetical protein
MGIPGKKMHFSTAAAKTITQNRNNFLFLCKRFIIALIINHRAIRSKKIKKGLPELQCGNNLK